MLKIDEIKKLKQSEIDSHLAKLSLELTKLRIQQGVDKSSIKTNRFRVIRKQIAQLLTVRNQNREIVQ